MVAPLKTLPKMLDYCIAITFSLSNDILQEFANLSKRWLLIREKLGIASMDDIAYIMVNPDVLFASGRKC